MAQRMSPLGHFRAFSVVSSGSCWLLNCKDVSRCESYYDIIDFIETRNSTCVFSAGETVVAEYLKLMFKGSSDWRF